MSTSVRGLSTEGEGGAIWLGLVTNTCAFLKPRTVSRPPRCRPGTAWAACWPYRSRLFHASPNSKSALTASRPPCRTRGAPQPSSPTAGWSSGWMVAVSTASPRPIRSASRTTPGLSTCLTLAPRWFRRAASSPSSSRLQLPLLLGGGAAAAALKCPFRFLRHPPSSPAGHDA